MNIKGVEMIKSPTPIIRRYFDLLSVINVVESAVFKMMPNGRCLTQSDSRTNLVKIAE